MELLCRWLERLHRELVVPRDKEIDGRTVLKVLCSTKIKVTTLVRPWAIPVTSMRVGEGRKRADAGIADVAALNTEELTGHVVCAVREIHQAAELMRRRHGLGVHNTSGGGRYRQINGRRSRRDGDHVDVFSVDVLVQVIRCCDRHAIQQDTHV